MEHPYETIKRQWGFDHIMTKKGIKAASADFGLMTLAYNLKRLINTGIGLKELLLKVIIATKTVFLFYIKPQNPVRVISKIKSG